MMTRLFSVNGTKDITLCEEHARKRQGAGEKLGVPIAAAGIMFGVKAWPTGEECCIDCYEEADSNKETT